MSIELFTIPELLGNGRIATIKTGDGTIYFLAREIASALGYINPHDAIDNQIDVRSKFSLGEIRKLATSELTDLPSGVRINTVFINEYGIYDLVFKSRLPVAREFKWWVISEVLPSIRKTGKYALPGVVGKLKSIEDSELRCLKGPEWMEVKSELARKTNLMKDPEAVLRGRKGGLAAQENNRRARKLSHERGVKILELEEKVQDLEEELTEKIHELEDENKRLWIENKNLKEQ
ncbi:Hypothetical predicted protein [Paramuricea clavata]|uniref:Uncharacterized protein n=1 Tax=Paramuricea clavata TaxID=317549 RepID=A0A6S7H0Z3_PARCT|nr:Hypothetical predicted protein [Paramuricea clavata]